jgi:hypothetical protein
MNSQTSYGVLTRTVLVLCVSSVSYYLLLFVFGVPLWLGEVNILLSMVIFSCVLPAFFGYITHSYMRLDSKWSPLIVLVVPFIVNGSEYLIGRFETGGAPMEKTELVAMFWILQLIFFLGGAYANIKLNKRIQESRSQSP